MFAFIDHKGEYTNYAAYIFGNNTSTAGYSKLNTKTDTLSYLGQTFAEKVSSQFCSALNGYGYTLGGDGSASGQIGTIKHVDDSSVTTDSSTIVSPKSGGSASTLNSKIYLFGGTITGQSVPGSQKIQSYDGSTSAQTAYYAGPSEYSAMTCTMRDYYGTGTGIFHFGGSYYEDWPELEPSGPTWGQGLDIRQFRETGFFSNGLYTQMSAGVGAGGIGGIDQYIFLFGGSTETYRFSGSYVKSNYTYKYNTYTGAYSASNASLPFSCFSTTAVGLGKEIYIFGYSEGSSTPPAATKNVYKFNQISVLTTGKTLQTSISSYNSVCGV